MVGVFVRDCIQKLCLHVTVNWLEGWQHPFLVGQIPGKLVDEYKLSIVVWLVVRKVSKVINGPEEVCNLDHEADGRGGEYRLAGKNQC